MDDNKIIKNLKKIFSTKILINENDKKPFLEDWRKEFIGEAIAVVFPINIEEIKSLLIFAKANNLSLIPQGGNTGLCGGATPNKNFNNILISFKSFNKIRSIDIISNTIIVESGCVLESIQNEVDKFSKVFPIDLSSKGSCTIGGNIGTNAGGNNVIRYGSTRDVVLGIEAILPNGNIINNLSNPLKDNTEYPFHKLLVGSEGTLGIITAAKIKLFEKPKSKITICIQIKNIEMAMEAMFNLKSNLGNDIEAFEIMTKEILEIIYKHFPKFKKPFSNTSDFIGIVDIVTTSKFDIENYINDKTIFENKVFSILENLYKKDIIQNAVIAQSNQQKKQIWEVRENANIAQGLEGNVLRHDISLPLDNIISFWNQTTNELLRKYNQFSICAFGHLGDGNIHFNLIANSNNKHFFNENLDTFKKIVLNNVYNLKGSFSAEHGIGQLKKQELLYYKDKNTIKLMREIKQTFDPSNILNPGKMIN